MPKAKSDRDLPAWFDPALHSAATGGLFETATGTLLGPGGEPASPALRLLRDQAAADAAQAPADPRDPGPATPDTQE